MFKIKNAALLQLFAEGGDGTGAPPAAEGQTGEAPAAAGQEETAEEAFARFIDKYGEDAKPLTDHHQKNFNKKYATFKEAERQAKRLSAFRDVVAKRYGVDGNDIDALENAFLSDEKYYEERAFAEGRTAKDISTQEIQQLKINRLEEQISEENKRKTLEKKAREFRANMHAQEAEMKKAYPDFDLGKEMKNPKMQSLLASGVSLEDAYHAIHHKELLQKTAEEAKNATVSSIAAKGTRVSEGASSATVPATTKTDFSKMSRAEFMKIFNQR